MPARQVAGSAGEEAKAAAQLAEHRLWKHQPDPHRSQLDRQRQAIQPGADLGDCRAVVGVERRIGPDRLCPLAEQLYRFHLPQLFGRECVLRLGKHHLRDRVGVLTVHPQQGAARHERFELRRRRQQLGDLRRSRHHVLEVVEHQQHLLVTEVLLQPHQGRLAAKLTNAQRRRDGGHHERWIAHWRKRDEEDAVLELVQYLGGHLQSEPGLAHAARAREREQPHVRAQQLAPDGDDVGLATDESRDLGRQVVSGSASDGVGLRSKVGLGTDPLVESGGFLGW